MRLEETQNELLRFITSESQILPRGIEYPQRLFIYRNGFLARIIDSLLETFKRTAFALGEEQFHTLSEMYARSREFAGFDLGSVANEFPHFLEKSFAGQESFLPDLSWFELKFSEVFHAPACPVLTLEQLQVKLQTNAENLRFLVQPFVRTRKSRWPLIEICHEIDRRLSQEPPALESQFNFSLLPNLGHHLIYSQNWQVKNLSLSEYQAIFFDCLHGGSSLVEACVTLERYMENSSANEDCPVHEWLGEWVKMGIFCEM